MGVMWRGGELGGGEGYFSHPGLTSCYSRSARCASPGQPKGLSLRGPRVAALGFAFAGRTNGSVPAWHRYLH